MTDKSKKHALVEKYELEKAEKLKEETEDISFSLLRAIDCMIEERTKWVNMRQGQIRKLNIIKKELVEAYDASDIKHLEIIKGKLKTLNQSGYKKN